MGSNKLKIFSANANIPLAEEIAEYLGVPLGSSQVKTFCDGEKNPFPGFHFMVFLQKQRRR